jgi:hypothetical protein
MSAVFWFGKAVGDGYFVCFWGITGDGDLGEHWDFSQPEAD